MYCLVLIIRFLIVNYRLSQSNELLLLNLEEPGELSVVNYLRGLISLLDEHLPKYLYCKLSNMWALFTQAFENNLHEFEIRNLARLDPVI